MIQYRDDMRSATKINKIRQNSNNLPEQNSTNMIHENNYVVRDVDAMARQRQVF